MVLVDDEDEFAEHQLELGYPPAVVNAAQRVTAIGDGQEPWASIGHAWRAQAVDLALTPLPGWADEGRAPPGNRHRRPHRGSAATSPGGPEPASHPGTLRGVEWSGGGEIPTAPR